MGLAWRVLAPRLYFLNARWQHGSNFRKELWARAACTASSQPGATGLGGLFAAAPWGGALRYVAIPERVCQAEAVSLRFFA